MVQISYIIPPWWFSLLFYRPLAVARILNEVKSTQCLIYDVYVRASAVTDTHTCTNDYCNPCTCDNGFGLEAFTCTPGYLANTRAL